MGDITVKNIDEAVLSRLAKRAAAEGISVQELARRALARAAALPDLEDQLATRRAGRVPMSWEEFVARRRRTGS